MSLVVHFIGGNHALNIWRIDHNSYQFKEYVNGRLSFDNIYPYSDDVGTSFEAFTELEELAQQDGTVQPNIILPPVETQPAFCIMEGTCCKFSGKTYAYCGKYCGYKQKAGGRDNGADVINSLDSCCYWHDWCLKEGIRNQCGCHDGFLDCASRTSGAPGKWTIYAGILAARKLDKC